MINWEVSDLPEIPPRARPLYPGVTFGIGRSDSEYGHLETTPETERSNYFMFVGRMCTTLDPSLQGSNCPAGMISCDMLSVLCYLWIYSKLSVALRLNKTCNPHNAWSILFKWVSSHETKGSNSDTWIRFKRSASFRKEDIS